MICNFEQKVMPETHVFPSELYKKVTEQLLKLSHFDGAFLTTSGSRALETALQLGLDKCPGNKKALFTFESTYLSTHLAKKYQRLSPLQTPPNIQTLPFPVEGCPHSIQKFKEALQSFNHFFSTPGVFVFEPFLGEGGFLNPDIESLKTFFTLLQSNGFIIIADETHSFLRSPEVFATRYYGLDAFVDIYVLGKALQTSALLFRAQGVSAPEILSGTFAGATSSFRQAFDVLCRVSEGEYHGQNGLNQKLDQSLKQRLSALQVDFSKHMGAIHVCGSLASFSFAQGDSKKTTELLKNLFKLGYTACRCGLEKARVRLVFPINICSEDLDIAFNGIRSALQQTLSQN